MKPTTILCIEDNADNMMLLSRVFRSGSYCMVEARNGTQGLKIAESQEIDLILLDINLPDIDGYEVARRLRSSTKAELAHIPIIAVTANAMKADAERCLDAGCDLYISKPIDIQELWETVEALVPSKCDRD
jgi:two-component system, cell cycle response regulator DivK